MAQIGDGGVIAQIRDNKTGKAVAATSGSLKVHVVDKAPLNPECVTSSNPLVDFKSSNTPEPANWSKTGGSNSGWSNASVYTPQEVGAKDGYNTITWSPSAKPIWSSDLELDNTVLLRTSIKAP